ncbi:MAG: energy-coupled thiamine transporter ThiT [Lachnospiraceae bacterium]|nr:energy-coupled thiamine transporter ThiT [Lachnospiraceae bacterium]
MEKERNKTRILTESAVLVAVAVVLSLLSLFLHMPWGGSVTPAATLPVIVVSLRYGVKWGVLAALTYSLTQLLLGFSNVVAVPAPTLGSMVLCALLDYVLAYTLIGMAGGIARGFARRELGLAVAILATGLGRYLCSVLSGAVLWGEYAWEGWSVVPYSMAYNAIWCGPDVAITLVAGLLLLRVPALDIMPVRQEVK